MILGYINLGEIINRYISACANTDGSTSQFTVGLCRQLCCKAGSCPSESPCHVSVLQISDTQAAAILRDDKHSTLGNANVDMKYKHRNAVQCHS